MSLNRREFLVATGTTAGAGVVGTAAAQESPTVRMLTEGDDYMFDPIGLYVEPGTTVTFKNVRGSHNSVSYADRIPLEAAEWSTPIGETTEHTFEEPGTYDYYCQPHKTLGMVGRVVVGEPGGPAEGSMPPDGNVPESDVIVERGSVSHEAFASGDVGGSDTESSDGFARPLIGAGLFGSLTVVTALVYWAVNSEGERVRVGSSAWKQRYGLK